MSRGPGLSQVLDPDDGPYGLSVNTVREEPADSAVIRKGGLLRLALTSDLLCSQLAHSQLEAGSGKREFTPRSSEFQDLERVQERARIVVARSR